MFYLEHMDLEPRGGSGMRPVTGWTVPCTRDLSSTTGLCSPKWWAPANINFTGW